MVLDMEFMVRSTATTGAYNYAAISGVPSILIERGGAGLCLREDIDAYKKIFITYFASWGYSQTAHRYRANIHR